MADAEHTRWAEVRRVEPAADGPSPMLSLVGAALVVALVYLILGPWFALGVAVAALLTVLLERYGPRRTRPVFDRIRRWQQALGNGLRTVVLAGLWATVVLPIGLFRRRTPGAGWRQLDHRAQAPNDRQFSVHRATERARPRALTRIATAIGAIVLLLAVDVAAGSIYDAARSPDDVDRRAAGESYASTAWGDQYWEDFTGSNAFDYVSYVGWRRSDYVSEFVNLSNGERHTWQSAAAAAGGQDVIVVWMFGGSTTWGTGQRDDHTIASYLARLGDDEGITLDVRNFGESGHRLWQENLHLQRRLLVEEAPDIVIFYDGVNEPSFVEDLDEPRPIHSRTSTFAARLEAEPDTGGPRSLMRWWRSNSMVVRAGRAARDLVRGDPDRAANNGSGANAPSEVAANVAAVYREAVAAGVSLGERHGFQVVHFWQPTIYTKRLDPDETDARNDIAYTRGDTDWLTELYSTLRATLPDGVIDITDALDDAPAPVMIDPFHTNELGARIVAERILRELEPLLADGSEQ